MSVDSGGPSVVQVYSANARYNADEITWHNLDAPIVGAAQFETSLYSAGYIALRALYSARLT